MITHAVGDWVEREAPSESNLGDPPVSPGHAHRTASWQGWEEPSLQMSGPCRFLPEKNRLLLSDSGIPGAEGTFLSAVLLR